MTSVRTVELVGMGELVRAFGVSRARMQQIAIKADFPEPLASLGMGKVWDLADIRAWAEAHGRILLPLDAAVDDAGSAEESPRTS